MFVNRKEEIDVFEKAIRTRLTHGRGVPQVLCYTGLMGIGKTHLLNKLYDLAQDKPIPCAIGDAGKSAPLELMSHWARKLGQSGLAPTVFEAQYQRYRELRNEIVSQDVKGLPELLAQAAMRTGLTLAELNPTSKLLKSFIDQESLIQTAGEWGKYLSQARARKRKLNDVELLLDPIKLLTPVFTQGLKGRPAILFLDDFERMVALDPWLIKLVDDTPNVLWVIASWGGLRAEWESTREITYCELEAFQRDAIIEFLAKAKLHSRIPEKLDAILDSTLGLPFALHYSITLKQLRDPRDLFGRQNGNWELFVPAVQSRRHQVCAVFRDTIEPATRHLFDQAMPAQLGNLA